MLKFTKTLPVLCLSGLLAVCSACSVDRPDYSATDAEICRDLALLPQDLQAYASIGFDAATADLELVTPSRLETSRLRAAERFYAPWNFKPGVKTKLPAKEAMWGAFSLKPERGYIENLRPYPQKRWAALKKNSNLSTYPNSNLRAITLRHCDLRLMPTASPYFFNPGAAGQGYPFDYLQNSSLPLGTPIRIIHVSKDGQWALSESASAIGWINMADLAAVDEAFILAWTSRPLAALTMEDTEIPPDYKNEVSAESIAPHPGSTQKVPALPPLNRLASIGALLPYDQTSTENSTFPLGSRGFSANRTNNLDSRSDNPPNLRQPGTTARPKARGGIKVFFPERGPDGQAKIASCTLNSTQAAPWPLPLTRRNLAELGNRMLGQPYGWGGWGGNRDCSTLMRDLFLPFGFWLPRNSGAQSNIGEKINLAKLTPAEKEAAILEQGVPFLSMVGMPGHIGLYIGKHEGRALIFHNIWGLRVNRRPESFAPAAPARVIIGKAVITTLTPGAERKDIATPNSLLDRVNSVNLLVPPSD
ncbi:MAG: SH3 domain-containing protein [Deltaproteobacteria bacterium]|nr:SH3 domain-containing protein [Deltaproteobacteria bacterium]